jgi:hypothetical protein
MMTRDLAVLGAVLQDATDRAVRRRRLRQHATRCAALSLVLSVSGVLGGAVGRLEPAAGPLPAVPQFVVGAFQPPTTAFMVRHIPDENAESTVPRVCLDALDCRSPIHPSIEPVRPGKY